MSRNDRILIYFHYLIGESITFTGSKHFKMKKTIIFFSGVLFLAASCTTGPRYAVTSASWERIPVIAASHPDSSLSAYVDRHKRVMEAEMDKVIGYSAQEMMYERPESLLTNFTSDAMMQVYRDSAKAEKPDLAVMNVHGHRAPLAKGDITVGAIYNIYPFDNSLVIVNLKGNDLLDIFRAYAQIGGAGISGNVRLIIKDKQLSDAKVNGQAVDPDRIYRVVTLDYLSEGNDHMDAFKRAVSINATGLTLRDYILEYITNLTGEGKQITSRLDGRIIVE